MSNEKDKKKKKGREHLSLITNKERIKEKKESQNEPSWKTVQKRIGKHMKEKGVTTKDVQQSLKDMRKQMNNPND